MDRNLQQIARMEPLQYHFRYGIRFSSVYDFTHLYDDYQNRQQLSRSGERSWREQRKNVLQNYAPPFQSGNYEWNLYGVPSLYDKLRRF